MPIQIIPKEAAKLPLWQNILFYFSIGLALSVLAAYGVLYHFTQKATEDAKNIDTSIQQGKTPQMLSLENQVKSYRDMVNNFSSLINNHEFSSNFFGNFEQKTGILEKLTHPKVSFSGMDFNADGNSVSLSGLTDDFKIIGQQIALFKSERMINSVILSKVEKNKDGKIEFTLEIRFSPELLKSFCGNGIKEGAEECDSKDGVPENYICTDMCKLQAFK